MSDYIVPSSFRKPLLDWNRDYYPECSHLSDDEFEKFLLALPPLDEDDPERDNG